MFGKNKLDKFIFIKPFDKDNNPQLTKLEELLSEVSDDQKSKIEKEMNNMNYGLIGEQNVNFELENMYHIGGYVFHDVSLKYNSNVSQFDFIVLTRSFICVIETKNLYGNITITNDGAFIREFRSSANQVYKKESMYSPISQNKKHCSLLNEILSTKKYDGLLPIKSLVCCSNPRSILKKNYAPVEIKDIVIKTDALCNKFEEWNNDSKDLINDKKMDAIKDFISEHIIEKKYDYVKTLKLVVDKPTKVKKKTVQNKKVADNNDEKTKEVVNNESNEVEISDDLYEELKSYRLNKSKETNLKAYMIFTNDQLEKLIIDKPIKETELYKITGFTKKKVELYGNDIINIIKKYFPEDVKQNEELESNPIYKKLKKYRYDTATSKNIKPYFIFTNKQLESLIEKMPSNKTELKEIQGFADKKIEMYGDSILNIINKK